MSAFTSFYSWISTNSNITSLLATATDIHPAMLPENHNSYPALTYKLSSSTEQELLDGSVNELEFAVFEIRIWGYDIGELHTIATTIKTEMRTPAIRGTFGAHTAENSQKMGEHSMPTEPDTRLESVVLEYRIAYH